MRPIQAATRFAAGRGIFVREASTIQIQAALNGMVAPTAYFASLICNAKSDALTFLQV
jgi:hypothetical protein